MSRILIIDDEEAVRRALRTILERAGHIVLDAPNGRDGMRLRQDVPLDVVVTDIYMPEKDGMQVLSEIKQLATKPKIIAMSGGGHKGLLDWRAAALALGAHGVLLKPFDERTVLEIIQEVLTGHTVAHDVIPRSRSTEQRKSPRLSVSLPVYFSNSMIAQSGTVIDISREGCRIRCPDAALDMRYFQVEIHLDEEETLTINLAVRRWSRDKELGVEFIRLEPDQQNRLLGVIRKFEEASSE